MKIALFIIGLLCGVGCKSTPTVDPEREISLVVVNTMSNHAIEVLIARVSVAVIEPRQGTTLFVPKHITRLNLIEREGTGIRAMVTVPFPFETRQLIVSEETFARQ